MEEGYRVPRLEEFVQGFEFEVAKDTRFFILDLSAGADNSAQFNQPFTRHWLSGKVWWKHPPENRIIERSIDGTTLNISGYMVNFFKPFDEAEYIRQGLVRVKINPDSKLNIDKMPRTANKSTATTVRTSRRAPKLGVRMASLGDRPYAKNSTGVKGVRLTASGKFSVSMYNTNLSTSVHIGTYDTLDKAKRAYRKQYKMTYGAFPTKAKRK